MILRCLFAGMIAIASIAPAQALERGDQLVRAVQEPFLGDFDEMKQDKIVRALISYSLTDYFVSDGEEHGLAVEFLRAFDTHINKGIKKETDKIAVVLIPTRRDRLLPDLVEGKGDMVVANLTVTPDRLESVDFADPLHTGVNEVLVTAAEGENPTSVEDMAGMEIHVRASSSYFESLAQLNEALSAKNLDQIKISEISELFEDEDLLEMVDTGLIQATVVDDYTADLWAPVFKNLAVHETAPLREDAEIAWAIRKDSPLMKAAVDGFMKTAKVGTELGNILTKRYFSDTNRIVNPKVEAYQEKLEQLMVLFDEMGKKYNIDPYLLAAQAFQESRFNNNAKSHAGAVGIMQLLPSTAKDKSVNIKNFRELEGNIEAGAKYNRFVADTYFPEEDIPEFQKILFVLASYNAGPNRVARVRKKASDPNTWFDSVEWEVAKAAGVEPVKYVKNIYTYYVAFKEFAAFDEARAKLADEQ